MRIESCPVHCQQRLQSCSKKGPELLPGGLVFAALAGLLCPTGPSYARLGQEGGQALSHLDPG